MLRLMADKTKKNNFSACRLENTAYICIHKVSEESSLQQSTQQAKVAQLVEHDLAKVGVASSNLVFRSTSP